MESRHRAVLGREEFVSEEGFHSTWVVACSRSAEATRNRRKKGKGREASVGGPTDSR